jgi:hypothetical protein
VTTDFKTLNIIAEGNKVVINGTAEFMRDNQRVSFVSACDVYEFDDNNQIQNITSYCIQKAKNKFHDKYDYCDINYVDSKTKIKIKCNEHNDYFLQVPAEHLRGRNGCKFCQEKNTTVKDVKEKIDKNKSKILTIDEFIKRAKKSHGDKYDYSKVEYINSQTKVKIICPEHGEFWQLPYDHISKHGCNKCSSSISNAEIEINGFLTSHGLITKLSSMSIIKPHQLDIFIPSHNLAIEYNGLYWHSEEFLKNNYHLNKTIECEKQGIQLIHIFEDEWLHKQNIVKSRLLNILGLIKNKIYARKTEIKEISSIQAKNFLDNNHLQGFTNSTIRIGLFYDNELISVMLFNKPRLGIGSSYDGYELTRFANKLNTSVIGGASKLLKHFINTYQPKEIISYADRRWSQGDLYKKLGFKFVSNTPKSFSYIINNKREYRFKFRKDVLIKLGFDSKKTSHEIMLERNIFRIYDCGNKKYKLIRPESHRSKT